MASGKKTVVRRVKASSDNASASPQRRKASADKSASVADPADSEEAGDGGG